MKPASVSRRVLLLIPVLLAAATVVSLMAWRLSASRRDISAPYTASLERRDDWTAYGGTWEAVDGAMRNNSDERGAKLMSGSPYWKNY